MERAHEGGEMNKLPCPFCGSRLHKEPDMSKKCEKLNASVWRLLEYGDTVQKGDQVYIKQEGVFPNANSGWQSADDSIGHNVIGSQPYYRRKITLPAPLTPIALDIKQPEIDSEQWFYNPNSVGWPEAWEKVVYTKYTSAMFARADLKYTHWLPQDALPVPVQEENVLEALDKVIAEHEILSGDRPLHNWKGLTEWLKIAAKELRK